MNYKLRFFAAVLFCLALTQPVGYSRQVVDSADKFNLLNTATGDSDANSGPPGSFQSRLDAVAKIAPTEQRTVVSTDDAETRARIIAQQQQEALLEEEKAENLTRLSEDDEALLKSKDSRKPVNQRTKTSSKVDGSEKAYQKERAEIRNEFDKRVQKGLEKKSPAGNASAERTDSSLDPSLANNPFYFKPKEESGDDLSRQDFETKKPLIAIRIADSGGALNQEQAVELVRTVSSSDELVLKLIRDYGYTYGQASDAVS